MSTRNLTKVLSLTTALAVAGLVPASAAPAPEGYGRGPSRAYDRYDSYDRDGRYDRRGREEWGGARFASVARQLAREAGVLNRQARQVNPRPNPPVARVVASLDRLDASAERYERHLAVCARSGRHRESELADLLDAYDAMLSAVDGINPQRYMSEGIARIDNLIGQLPDDSYSQYGQSGRGWRDREDRGDRYGRYGRDGRSGY